MKHLVLGGSRGLGAEICKQLNENNQQAISYSRQNKFDFSKLEKASEYIQQMQNENPVSIIYCAGGGPFGKFADKDFHSHEWAWKVNFQFPAYLLHVILQNPAAWPQLRRVAFMGSAVADHKPDPMASSYAAAKHALRGLITSVQMEGTGDLEVHLFSPPYMDTGLLPPHAWPRKQVDLVKKPSDVARAFLLDFLKELLDGNSSGKSKS